MIAVAIAITVLILSLAGSCLADGLRADRGGRSVTQSSLLARTQIAQGRTAALAARRERQAMAKAERELTARIVAAADDGMVSLRVRGDYGARDTARRTAKRLGLRFESYGGSVVLFWDRPPIETVDNDGPGPEVGVYR